PWGAKEKYGGSRPKARPTATRQASHQSVYALLRCQTSTAGPLHFDAQQLASVFVAGGAEAVLVVAVVAVGAARDARQRHDLAPAERRTNRTVLLANRMEVFLAVQAPIFAHRILEHQVERWID